MNQFIIALPLTSGHHWQHWATYHAYQKNGAFYLDQHSSCFSGGRMWDQFGLAFQYQPSSTHVLRMRLNQLHEYERHYVTSGTVKIRKEKIPIRFVSVTLHFASGYRLFTDKSTVWDQAYKVKKQIEAIIAPKRWSGINGHTIEINERVFWQLKTVFDTLKHSQISWVSRLPTNRQKARSLKGLYNAVADWEYRRKASLLEVIYPPSCKSTQKAVRRCVERFVRRHPTQATKRLLQIIAGSSALRHL